MPHGILNDEQVIGICQDNRRYSEIAYDYNVLPATIYAIKSRLQYCHITKDIEMVGQLPEVLNHKKIKQIIKSDKTISDIAKEFKLTNETVELLRGHYVL